MTAPSVEESIAHYDRAVTRIAKNRIGKPVLGTHGDLDTDRLVAQKGHDASRTRNVLGLLAAVLALGVGAVWLWGDEGVAAGLALLLLGPVTFFLIILQIAVLLTDRSS